MTMSVSRVDVWAADVEDRPGGMAEKLEALADAGTNLEFVIARRRPEKPGQSVVFLTPITGAKQIRVAKKVGFAKTTSLHSVRIEAPDKPGLGAALSRQLAEAGINMRGLSAAAIGRKCIVHLAFDTTADAAKATRILKKM